MLIFCLSRVKFNQFDPRFLRFAIRFDSFTTECGSMQSSFDDGRFNISFFASLSLWGWFSVLIGPEMKEPLLASHFDSILANLDEEINPGLIALLVFRLLRRSRVGIRNFCLTCFPGFEGGVY